MILLSVTVSILLLYVSITNGQSKFHLATVATGLHTEFVALSKLFVVSTMSYTVLD